MAAIVSPTLLSPLLVIMAIVPAVADEKSLPDLVTIGAPAQRAEFISVEPDGDLHFRDAAGKTFQIGVIDLVHWSTPSVSRAPDELLLIDGSRLRLAAAWGKEPSFTMGQAALSAKTHELGKLKLPRSRARAVYWRLPTDGAARQKRIDDLLAAQTRTPESDVLLLDNGDLLTGTLTGIGQGGVPFDTVDGPVVATVISALGEIKTPIERVRGIAFSPTTAVPPATDGGAAEPLYIGLNDGSLVAANLAGRGDEVVLQSIALGERTIAAKEVVSIQANGAHVTYLSDLVSTGYRHEPYLDLQWPYASDRNVLGSAPTTAGRSYLKAIGMHSASRLTFDLDGAPDRFAAAIALDDAAKGGGSVTFRVFLKPKDGGEWREAFASGVVRGGDPPKDVSVDLAGAKQLALVVDYADRGDERDYANWLDARLEWTE